MRKTETLPRPQLEALYKTCSAAALSENQIRGVYPLRGKLYVCTGGMFSKEGIAMLNADELILLEHWTAETVEYGMLAGRADMEDGWRGGRFYQGVVVSHKGKKYVLAGREVKFTPEIGTTITATKQLSLFDC